MDLLKKLPDLNRDLISYGINSDSARGDYKLTIDKNKNTETSLFTFHSSSSKDVLERIIQERFVCSDDVIFCYEFSDNRNSAIISTRRDQNLAFSFPESRSTLDHRNIYYLEKLNTPEIVDLYLISYGLSMLSRYYPDIWITFIESHCKGAKLVEGLISILISKTPILILNQFMEKQYVISNHRPIWH